MDTPKDPYSSIKGFWYAHIGWMLVKQDKEKIGRADISDLNARPLIRLQHKYYVPLALIMVRRGVRVSGESGASTLAQ